jgi:hypothetical protein
MTESKSGTTKIWAIVVPCIIAALTFGYSIGLSIGISTSRPPFITAGAETQIKILSAAFDDMKSELKDFRITLDAQSTLLTEVATKVDAHMRQTKP